MDFQETEMSVNAEERNDKKTIFTVESHLGTDSKDRNRNENDDDNSLSHTMSSNGSKSDGTWHDMSGLYAQIIVVVAAILVFTELLHGPVPLFFFHGYLFTYLVGGGVICFICAYLTMLTSKCRCGSSNSYDDKIQNSIFSAQFMRNLLFSDISMYLRMGAVVFGLGTLISCGLEVASIFTVPNKCMDELNVMQPILRGLFTFLQLHFLFMNANEMLNSFRWFRHIALMHLVATNLAVWTRIMLWESTKDWLEAIHHKHNSSIDWYQAAVKINFSMHTLESDSKSSDPMKQKMHHKIHFAPSCHWTEETTDAEDLIAFHICIRNSTIGAIWEKAMPYLYPFTVQYCLVAAAVIYIVWCNTQTPRMKLQRFTQPSVYGRDPAAQEDVNCSNSTRGLFLGLLVLVAGVIALILFFVLSQDKDFNVLFLIGSLECGIFGVSILASVIGLLQIRRMKSKTSRERRLSELLQRIGMLAVYIYGICNIIVGGVSMNSPQHFVLFLHGSLMVVQACLQSLFIHQVSKKRLSPLNMNEKPGRQVVIFMVFSNIVLWILESFTTQNQVRSKLQLYFFGYVAWPVITRVVLPLVIFYRFHSAVALMEAWRKSYKVKQN